MYLIFGMAAMPFLCNGILPFQGNLPRVLSSVQYIIKSLIFEYTQAFIVNQRVYSIKLLTCIGTSLSMEIKNHSIVTTLNRDDDNDRRTQCFWFSIIYIINTKWRATLWSINCIVNVILLDTIKQSNTIELLVIASRLTLC